MMILITTPTGNVGSRVLRDLAQREPGAARVIVRHPEKLPPEIRESVEVITGSHDDPATLIRALEGVDAMFWCQPDTITAEDYYGFYRDFASAGCEAIRQQQTPRVVVLSATGGTFNGQAGPITALHQMEDILSRSGAHLRFLRCGSFFENFLWQIDALRNAGTFYYPMAGDVAHPMVASDDIGEAAARWLTRTDWTGIDAIQVLGPADLSYNEAGSILSEELGRPIRYTRLTANEYRESLLQIGYQPNPANALIAMFAAIEQGIAKAEARDPLNTGTTTFASWAIASLCPLLK
jgi:uncharacterized protein YbjT (DUF2867 family)